MESTTETKTKIANLKQKWDDLKREYPKLRSRDIAERLDVSEAELVASACNGETVVRLTNDWKEIFQSLESLGSLMALTRNDAAVHEKTGIYQNVSFKGHAGLVLDENIDLRVFHKRWGFGFALHVENPVGTLQSLQFFDKEGNAVHKIYLKNDSKKDEWLKLVEKFRADDQSDNIEVIKQLPKEGNSSPEEVETDTFLDAWSELKDTHDFYPMLKKFKLDRTDAFQLAKEKYTWRAKNSATRKMLELVSKQKIPIMVFVRNSGMIQIHSGPVNKIRVLDNWLNVLDSDFNLHLREDLIDSSWVVEKPTEDGIVTSLEIFDISGEQIATFFGARKPGKPELEPWRETMSKMKKMESEV